MKNLPITFTIKKINRIKRTWLKLEKAFKEIGSEILEAAISSIKKQSDDIIKSRNISEINRISLTLSDLKILIEKFLVQCRRAGRGNGATEVLELKAYWEKQRKKTKKLDQTADILEFIVDRFVIEIDAELDSEDKEYSRAFEVVPRDAIKFYQEYSLFLTRVYEEELLKDTKNTIISGLENGFTVQEVMDGLQSIFKNFSDNRLENIARTELSKAYNKGRLEAYKDPDLSEGFIKALQFSAIMDSRVSDICEGRNGLILEVGDSAVEENTPPLHFMCRSTWIPIDKYTFAQGNYSEKLNKGWDKVDRPLKGFGGRAEKPGEKKNSAPPVPRGAKN